MCRQYFKGASKGTNSSAEKVGDATHSDLARTFPTTQSGKRYLISFIDEKKRSAKIAVLEKNSDTKDAFIEYRRYRAPQEIKL